VFKYKKCPPFKSLIELKKATENGEDEYLLTEDEIKKQLKLFKDKLEKKGLSIESLEEDIKFVIKRNENFMRGCKEN